MEFSKEQLQAINTLDKNIIVSAAAGSGKTSVLVNRIIKLIVEDKKDILSFIIVTFTNKASVEMKDRIRGALEKKLIENTSDYKFIKDQLKKINHSHIQTFHSFCADMLRENFYYMDNISPNFKILEKNTATILMSEVLDNLFDKEYEKMDENFKNFLRNFAKTKDDKDAKDVILKTYQKITSQIDPISWLDKACKNDNILVEIKKIIIEKLNNVTQKAKKNYNYSKEHLMRDKLIELIENDFEKISNLKKESENDWDKFSIEVNEIKFGTIRQSRNDDKIDYNYIKDLRDNYKEEIKSISNFVVNTNSTIFEEFSKKEKELLFEINYLVKEFIKTYKSYKIERNSLDFSDLEHEFINLIEKDEVRDKLKEKFKYIFFDEYQDSNEIQNYIIEKLKGKNNLFFVGDVKQSIYAFRNAKPKLFLKKLDDYSKDNDSIRIDLNKNYRSQKDILDFVNFIFDKLMTKENSDIDYKEGGHRLNFKKNNKANHKRVNIKVIDEKVKEEDYLVDLIWKIKDLGYDFKDIAILLRSGSKSYLFEQAFKKAEIPFFNDISNVTLNAIEVNFFINLLKYIVNPKDDITLLSILRSEIFGFSEDDLVKIRINLGGVSFVDAFNLYETSKNYDKGLICKIKNFKTIFSDLSKKLSIMNLYDFGNYLFENTGFYEFLLSRDRAEDRINNVYGFIDLMDDYDKNNDNGLFGFINYIDMLSKNKSEEMNISRNLSESENLVRIMTIHKSKGLEFPVVIIAESSKGFNTNHTKQSIVFDDELGIGINNNDYENKVRFPSIRKKLINEKITIENKKEEMRILYVAMTRAEKELFIIGNMKIEKIEDRLKKKNNLLDMNSYMDWILSILSNEVISNKIFKDTFENNLTNIAEVEVITESTLINKFENVDISEFFEKNDVNHEIIEKFKEIYDKTYPYKSDTEEMIKRSVTEVSKNFDKSNLGYVPFKNDDTNYTNFRKPNFLEEKKIYNPVEKGTLIHKVFQVLDIKDYDLISLRVEIEKFVEKKFFKDDVFEIIDLEKILDFFKNPIIKKLKKDSINIRKEESFLMKYEDIYLNGQIDLMFELKEEIILLDFKTDSIKRSNFYNKQLEIYKKAIEESLDKKVSKTFIYWYNFKELEEIN
ncbi:MAG: helicase-exonuclease AddAB subunit AddA [Peptoniphilaceae bacterium]|nr:helicase-exonuclease AddAB subunit AddA [Peptoniphilaceae bacterium]MDD7383305.1 helicase-exonuclease AddAB subunit AddA [Peptoniphilaceae bacterium]MDY3738324.1 helicase-exonuclease AddAB subunit AddA [Peptoniphilaceae bacterium]